MKLLVISQFYPPDLGAVAFRMEAIVNEMKERGHNVYVLTATPNRYKDFNPSQDLITSEFETRLQMKNTSKSIFSRILGFFEFYFRVLGTKKQYKNKSIDAVISTTPYILEGLAGQKISKFLHAKHILDVRDLWPDTPIALEKIKKNGIMSLLIKVSEKKLYKNANLIVVTSPGYVDHIKKIVKNAQPHVILNGIDANFENDLQNISFENINVKKDKFTILYAGNIGIAQNLITLIYAASKLVDLNYEFILIGSGTQLDQVKTLIKEKDLKNITIIPPMKRSDLFHHYLKSDALYLQLYSNEYFNKVVPSKIFEYLLLQKPIIYGLEGVSKEILDRYEGTYYVQPDNIEDLVSTIKNIDYNKIIHRDISFLRRKIQTQKYSKLIESVVEDNKR
jgi:glycosyltransferase involved in cell wall biosynthesis